MIAKVKKVNKRKSKLLEEKLNKVKFEPLPKDTYKTKFVPTELDLARDIIKYDRSFR